MIRRERFVNKLNELGYSYKSQGDRALLYKKPGNPKFVTVKKSDLLADAYVRGQLRLAGCGDDEIERFIAQNQA